MKSTTLIVVLSLLAAFASLHALPCDTVLFPNGAPGYNVIRVSSFPAEETYPSDLIYNDFPSTTESAPWGSAGVTTICPTLTAPANPFPLNSVLIAKRTVSFSAADINSVTLRITVDNDLLVYWNGQEIARAQIASNPGYTLTADGWIHHEGCANTNTYIVTIPKALLQDTNTLIVVARDTGVASYLDISATANGQCGCGNGILEAGEQCDAGTAGSPTCRPDCKFVCTPAQSTLCSSMGFLCCGNAFNNLEQCYSPNDHVCPFFDSNTWMCPTNAPLLCNTIHGVQCYSTNSQVCVLNENGNRVLCPAAQPSVCGNDFCYNSAQYNCQNGQLIPRP